MAWHFSGVTAESVRVSEKPNFQAGTAAQAEQVRLALEWRTLLKGLRWAHPRPRQSDGFLKLGRLTSAYYDASTVELTWHAEAVDPASDHVRGTLVLYQGPGWLRLLPPQGALSPPALSALQVLSALSDAGSLQLGLPKLEKIQVESVQGRASFTDALLHVDSLDLVSLQGKAHAHGLVNGTSQTLALELEVKIKNAGAEDTEASLQLTGPFAHPQIRLKSLKQRNFHAAIQGYLKAPPGAQREIRDKVRALFR